MIKQITLLTLVLGLSLHSTLVSSQTEDVFNLPMNDTYLVSEDTISLMEVTVVSGTKFEVMRNQLPANISVVGRETLERSTHTGVLSVLSEQVPGLFVTRRSVTGYGISGGSAGTVNIHGVGSGNKVLMLFDGQPMWAGVFGHSIADAYVASDAERVEVIRGPGSLLYGSNAMGGVINVITRKADTDGLHGGGRIMYGSYNTQKYSGHAAYRKNKLNLYASVNHDRSDGHREHSDFHITNAYIRGGYYFSDNWNASADVILADFKVNNPGTITWPMFENWSKALRTTYSLSLSNHYEQMSGALQVYYNDGNHKIDDGYGTGGASRAYFFRSEDFVRGIALYESFRLFDGNQFTVGLDAKEWGGHAWNESKPGKDADSELMKQDVTELAAYLVAQQQLIDCLTLNAGIRLENNEMFGNEWVPQAGLSWRLSEKTTLKASVSKGFRSPNVNEMFSPWGMANPDLKPEKMWNYDLSWMQSFLNNRLQLELTAYLAEGENLIAARPRPEGNGMINVNTGTFSNKGVDFTLNYQIAPSLRVNTNYSYLDTDIRIAAAPRHKFFAGLQASWRNFEIAPDIQCVNHLYLEAYEARGVPAEYHIPERYENYVLMNCKLTYNASKNIRLFINGENLTDTSYETYTGYPMPGTVVLGGIDFRF